MGVFDGVHKGHQHLLKACKEWAEEVGTFTEVWLYHPHPRMVLHGIQVPVLTTLEERIALLKKEGVSVVRIIPFTRELSLLSGKRYIEEWIRAVSAPCGVVLGYDHRFGKERGGSTHLLREEGFAVKEVAAFEWEGAPVSSSRVRRLLAEGAVSKAVELLGYPFLLQGVVRPGRQEARRLGVPTANIPYPPEKLRLPAGIYVGWTQVGNYHDLPVRRGIPSLLYLPPEGDLEVHLLEGQKEGESLYGKSLSIGILDRLRPHETFDDAHTLFLQIQADVEAAKAYFSL